MSDEPLKWGQPSDIAKGVPTDAETAFAAMSPVGSAESHMSMTADQQIRAKAVEWAVTLYVGMNHGDPSTVVEQAEEFEDYIREGK